MAKKDMTNKVAVGVGIGMLAALSAGAYYLYGTNEGAKKRVKIRGWMLKAKGEVLEKLEKLKEVNEETYNELVTDVMRKYRGLKNLDQTEVISLIADMKKHWKNIKAQIDKRPKVRIQMKRTVKKITK